MAPQDTYLDDEEETWYACIYLLTAKLATNDLSLTPSFEAITTDPQQPSLYRRVRSFRQELQAVSLWLPGMRQLSSSPLTLADVCLASVAYPLVFHPGLPVLLPQHQE